MNQADANSSGAFCERTFFQDGHVELMEMEEMVTFAEPLVQVCLDGKEHRVTGGTKLCV